MVIATYSCLLGGQQPSASPLGRASSFSSPSLLFVLKIATQQEVLIVQWAAKGEWTDFELQYSRRLVQICAKCPWKFPSKFNFASRSSLRHTGRNCIRPAPTFSDFELPTSYLSQESTMINYRVSLTYMLYNNRWHFYLYFLNLYSWWGLGGC